jgi:pilus assembly protein CpaE
MIGQGGEARARLDYDDDGFDAVDDFGAVQPDAFASHATAQGAGSNPYAPTRDRRSHAAPRDPFAMRDQTGYAPHEMNNPIGSMIADVESALGETSVPRISIHCFCQRMDTAKLAEYVAADRRLARATTEVRPGGLVEALDYYRNQPTPSLIVVESGEPAPVLLANLDKLAEVCDAGTKVVLIGAHNDITLYRELMRRGVSEYLTLPLRPLQFIRAITSLYADPATPFVGRTLAFMGAKGGCGSSTLAHNVAYQLSHATQSNTVIVDYDLAFGTAGLDFYEEVTNKIRSTAPYVVLDLPHLWSGWMRRMLMTVDDVAITATPDLASLRNAKNLIDLVRKARPNDNPPQLILNQVGAPGRPEIPVKEFSKALGLEPALVLPFDPKLFGRAANNGQMIFEVNPRAKAAEGLAQFTQRLSRREAAPTKPRSILDQLFKRG